MILLGREEAFSKKKKLIILRKMKRLRQRIILYIFARVYTTEKHTHTRPHTDVETFHDPEVNFE